MLWPDEHTLLIADFHLGKPASFRKAGTPVPEEITHHDLSRLARLIEIHKPRRIAILGDLAHDRSAWAEVTMRTFVAWRRQHDDVEMVLVRGNHDRRAADPPAELAITAVDPGWPLADIELHHEPAATGPAPPILAGHLHPGVILRHPRRSSTLRAPCFWFTPMQGVLPAFGSFTGCAIIQPGADDRVIIVGESRVLPLASRAPVPDSDAG